MGLKKSTEINYGGAIKILSYGKSGAGKTYFAGGMCDMGPTLVICADKGLMSIKDKLFDTYEVNNWVEFNEAFAYLMSNIDKYKFVVLDSLTEVQRMLILHMCGDKGPTLQQWGEIDIRMHKVVTTFQNLPINVLTICLANENKDEVLGNTFVMPLIKGSLQQNLSAYYDVVLYHFTTLSDDKNTGEKTTQYYCLSENDNRFVAKNRGGKLNRVEINSYPQIYEKLIK